jgi:hypothetical protein
MVIYAVIKVDAIVLVKQNRKIVRIPSIQLLPLCTLLQTKLPLILLTVKLSADFHFTGYKLE